MKMGITIGLAILLMVGGIAFLLSGDETVKPNEIPIIVENSQDNNENILVSGDETHSGELISGDFVSGVISEENIVNTTNEVVTPNEVKPVKKENTQVNNVVSNANQENTTTQNNNIVNQENEVIAEEIIETVVDNTVIPSDSVGLLKIPKISLSQAILDGHSLEVLKKGLGHFDDTAYWQGNIGILGHNSGSAGHFEKLKNLVVGDTITYTTEYGTRTYKVSSITEISDTDWSVLANTSDNRITLITCVKGVPEKRLCVQAKEI